jgi:hypothetical protein
MGAGDGKMETGDNAMSREQRLERAQLRVLFNAPFFAAGVARLPVAWDEGVPTAITDGKDIRWNPGWFDQLKDEEVVTVYCEAVSHCMLGHLWRQPVGADMDNWGRACDAAARCMMDAFGKIQTNQGLANPFPLPEKVVREFNHAAYDEMAEEKIYRILQAGRRRRGSAASEWRQGQKASQIAFRSEWRTAAADSTPAVLGVRSARQD